MEVSHKKPSKTKFSYHSRQLPIIIEKDEDGFYCIECPVFQGCYTQGKTIDEALKNIQEVKDLCLEEIKLIRPALA